MKQCDPYDKSQNGVPKRSFSGCSRALPGAHLCLRLTGCDAVADIAVSLATFFADDFIEPALHLAEMRVMSEHKKARR